MAQASVLKSPSITAYDSQPPVPVASGQGAEGFVRNITDFVSPLSGDTTASSYRVLRFPTNAKVKGLILNSTVAVAGNADINVAFSDSQFDFTPATVQGTIPQISAANNKLFGAAQNLVAQTNVQLIVPGLPNFPLSSKNAPVWASFGFTDDPGGYFDILLNVTTAVTTGGIIVLELYFVV